MSDTPFHLPKGNHRDGFEDTTCEVEVLLKDESESEPIQPVFLRLSPEQELFVWPVQDEGDHATVPIGMNKRRFDENYGL